MYAGDHAVNLGASTSREPSTFHAQDSSHAQGPSHEQGANCEQGATREQSTRPPCITSRRLIDSRIKRGKRL